MERNSFEFAVNGLHSAVNNDVVTPKAFPDAVRACSAFIGRHISAIVRLAALGLLTAGLSSCAVDAPFEDIEEVVEENDVIGFRVQTSSMTRAADAYSNAIRPSQFLVTAIDNGMSYFGQLPEMVSSPDNGNTWNTKNKLYWPKNKRADWEGLSFYAFIDGNDADYHNSFSGRSSAGQLDMADAQPALRNFVVDQDVESHKDLMYAVAKNVTKSTSNGKVRLNFRHALSQICFTAQNCNPTLEDIEIIKIELGGVKGAASYSFPASSTDAVRTTRSDDAGTWSIAPGAADMKYTLPNLFISLGATDESGKGKMVNISKPCFAKEKGVATVSNLSNTMYLIPQKVDARVFQNDPEGAYVKVTTRKTPKATGVAGQPEVTYIPLDVNWEEGRSYVYNLTWKATTISFSVTVADFDSVALSN